MTNPERPAENQQPDEDKYVVMAREMVAGMKGVIIGPEGYDAHIAKLANQLRRSDSAAAAIKISNIEEGRIPPTEIKIEQSHHEKSNRTGSASEEELK